MKRFRGATLAATVLTWCVAVSVRTVAAGSVTRMEDWGVPSLSVRVAGAAGAPIVQVTPFGANALRVHSSMDGSAPVYGPGALIPPSERTDATAEAWAKVAAQQPEAVGLAIDADSNTVTNGNIHAVVDGTTGLVTISRVSDGQLVFQETAKSVGPVSWEGGVSEGVSLATATGAANPSFYGFGEHQYGRLNRAGQTFQMEQCLEYGHSHGGEVCLPFILGGNAGGAQYSAGTSHGCFKDNSSRVLPYAAASNNRQDMTRDLCAKLCGEAHYSISGPEAGGQCYCGDALPPPSDSVSMSECQMPCFGDKSALCGGNWRLEAIDVNHGAVSAGSLDYGFLWNIPSYGSADFTGSGASWQAVGTSQIDYFVATSSADSKSVGGDIMNSYVDAVGHAPDLPSYATGYWHSKNRYASQDALLAAAEGFHNRSLNVSIIVIDYHHWVHMGDFSFDPAAWPDPQGMVDQLRAWGMEVMVSSWPFTAVNSSTFEAFSSKDLVVNSGNSTSPVWWNDNNCDAPCLLYDPTQQAARSEYWSALASGYYKYGIKIFWLDASEPEISTSDASKASNNASWSIGTFQSSGMMFPYWHTRSIHDGLISAGEENVVMLTRSAWAGMQRWGAALWSGDTQSTFASLQVSIQAGLSTQLSGIAWWTTDIGGYSGGNPSDPTFRELIVRWFQFGLTCPLFRQHGQRNTEPWLLGNESYTAVVKAMKLRETLRPYVQQEMQLVSKTGLPINRPLWFDFPEDSKTWDINSAYMFGSDYLVQPVTQQGARNATVYLPGTSSVTWTHYFSGKSYSGGNTVIVDAPLEEFPFFKRS